MEREFFGLIGRRDIFHSVTITKNLLLGQYDKNPSEEYVTRGKKLAKRRNCQFAVIRTECDNNVVLVFDYNGVCRYTYGFLEGRHYYIKEINLVNVEGDNGLVQTMAFNDGRLKQAACYIGCIDHQYEIVVYIDTKNQHAAELLINDMSGRTRVSEYVFLSQSVQSIRLGNTKEFVTKLVINCLHDAAKDNEVYKKFGNCLKLLEWRAAN